MNKTFTFLKISSLLALVFISSIAYAATYTSINDGNWGDANTWDLNAIPGPNDSVIVKHNIEYITNASLDFNGTIVIDDSGDLHIKVGRKIQRKDININGNITVKSNSKIKLSADGDIKLNSLDLSIENGSQFILSEATMSSGSISFDNVNVIIKDNATLENTASVKIILVNSEVLIEEEGEFNNSSSELDIRGETEVIVNGLLKSKLLLLNGLSDVEIYGDLKVTNGIILNNEAYLGLFSEEIDTLKGDVEVKGDSGIEIDDPTAIVITGNVKIEGNNAIIFIWGSLNLTIQKELTIKESGALLAGDNIALIIEGQVVLEDEAFLSFRHDYQVEINNDFILKDEASFKANNGTVLIGGSLKLEDSMTEYTQEGYLTVDKIHNEGIINGQSETEICSKSRTDRRPKITGNGTITLSSYCNNITLPITLTSFEGEVVNNTYFVFTWETQSEINNDYFTLEFSENGEEFIAIAEVEGGGTKYIPSYYEYNYTPTGITSKGYYRLRQTDYDGKTESFSPVYLELKNTAQTDDAGDIYVYPNPVKDNELYVELKYLPRGEYQLRLFSMNNQLIIDRTLNLEEHTRRKYEVLGNQTLEGGIYFLQVIGKEKSYTKKVIAN